MIYSIRQYKTIFNGPQEKSKKAEEKAIVCKLINLLKQDKYSDLNELVNSNPNLATFLKNNNFEIAISHFGNPLSINDNDFIEILKNFISLINKSQNLQSTENNFKFLNQINREILNDDEKQLYDIAVSYQINNEIPIKVNLSENLLIDNAGNTLPIKKENNNAISIDGNNNQSKGQIGKQKQLVLSTSQGKIYSDRKEETYE